MSLSGDGKLNILYEDEDVIVVHKAAGIPVQSVKVGKKDCCSELKYYLHGKYGGGEPYLGVIHRLDEPVEGLLVFAKNKRAAAGLSEQVRRGELKKEYTAQVFSKVPLEIGKKGELTDFLKKDAGANFSRVVSEDSPGAKKAVLSYEVTGKAEENRFFLKIRLYTGRHHQIRVQLKNAGMPICGDRKYGEDGCEEGLKLCASGLTFDHPVKKSALCFNITPVWA